MDFGSEICTSKSPSCNICIFDNECKKFIQVKQSTQPTFKGSDREIRGKIIKLVNKKHKRILVEKHSRSLENSSSRSDCSTNTIRESK